MFLNTVVQCQKNPFEALSQSSAHTSLSYFNAFHAAGVSRRQVKNYTNVSKMSTFWNLVTTFGTTMRNAIK